MKKNLVFWGFICWSVLSFGQTVRSSQTSGFDVNDVSILFPLDKKTPYPKISLQSHPALLSKALLAQILQFEHPGTPADELPYPSIELISQTSRWFVTSLRVDPCGDSLTSSGHSSSVLVLDSVPGQCVPKLKIVVQPVSLIGQPQVSALHLTFRLQASDFNLVVQSLSRIKTMSEQIQISTNGKPLSIHPGLWVELKKGTANSKPIGREILNLISTVAKAEKLEILTMTLILGARHWKFVGGVVQNGKWERFVSRFNHQAYGKNELSQLGIEELECNFYDICNSLPQEGSVSSKLITRIFRPDSAKRPDIEKQNPETTRLAEAIDHPRVGFFSTTCISCHQSSNYRDRQKLVLDSNQFPSPLGVTPFTFRQYVSDSPSSVINFGYDGLSARISTRTTAETALAAQRVNAALGLNNPGFKPSSLSQFWNCLMNSNISDSAKCFN